MHDIKWIRENAHAFDGRAEAARAGAVVGKAGLLDQQRRSAIVASEIAQARRNSRQRKSAMPRRPRTTRAPPS